MMPYMQVLTVTKEDIGTAVRVRSVDDAINTVVMASRLESAWLIVDEMNHHTSYLLAEQQQAAIDKLICTERIGHASAQRYIVYAMMWSGEYSNN